jgi:transcription-repair coupling factor (superfamily II helicase)
VRLSKMGGTEWAGQKPGQGPRRRTWQGVIALYAQRAQQTGHAFAPDSPWQADFEDRFEYEETEDQLRCIREIKADMEKPVPMDRLLCGDVGYGKTEVALRAVMKCVLDGKQAACWRHHRPGPAALFQTPSSGFSGSRLRSRASPAPHSRGGRETLRNLKSAGATWSSALTGSCRRIVAFKKLGAVIVDEEQRFGVSHKEHIKEMSRQVDVLTLSATPIPRTLNMALAGIRDMSPSRSRPRIGCRCRPS